MHILLCMVNEEKMPSRYQSPQGLSVAGLVAKA